MSMSRFIGDDAPSSFDTAVAEMDARYEQGVAENRATSARMVPMLIGAGILGLALEVGIVAGVAYVGYRIYKAWR